MILKEILSDCRTPTTSNLTIGVNFPTVIVIDVVKSWRGGRRLRWIFEALSNWFRLFLGAFLPRFSRNLQMKS
jgi:hypothetical protein